MRMKMSFLTHTINNQGIARTTSRITMTPPITTITVTLLTSSMGIKSKQRNIMLAVGMFHRRNMFCHPGP